jgi:hypothetical protein
MTPGGASSPASRPTLSILDEHAVGKAGVPTPAGPTPRQIGVPAGATLLPVVNVTA